MTLRSLVISAPPSSFPEQLGDRGRQVRRSPSSDSGVPLFACAALLLVLAAAAHPAVAQGSGGLASSSAFAESISLNVLPLLGSPVQVASGPLPAVAGSAPPAYDLSRQLASVRVSSPPLGVLLQAQLLEVDAASPEPAADQASADATIVAAQLRLAGLLPVVNLTASAVSSNALISGPCGLLPAISGSASLADAQLSGPLGLAVTVAAHPAPNTVAIDQLGLRVVLNEQIVTTDGVVSDITVNAVHVSLNVLPVTGLGLVSGDIILSQSQAHLDCSQSLFPAPGSE